MCARAAGSSAASTAQASAAWRAIVARTGGVGLRNIDYAG
jgi:hypothetical protein